jgi:hypothetical protein
VISFAIHPAIAVTNGTHVAMTDRLVSAPVALLRMRGAGPGSAAFSTCEDGAAGDAKDCCTQNYYDQLGFHGSSPVC